jgi:hypothetical protein
MDDLKSQLAIASLVSAYDIYHDYADREVALSDIVIIDSGNYEKRFFESRGCAVRWTRDLHTAVIDSISPLTQVAIVNYDEPGPLADQVNSARSFFEKYPQYAKDFLCKPQTIESSFVDVRSMVKGIEMFRDFDVLGVTYQELGPSLIEKCKNLLRLRRSLNSAELDVPIHVFGCFEPLSIVLMFILGGNIFDGLTWIRYALRDDVMVARGSIPFFDRKWSTDESDIRQMSASENLSHMTGLMFRMRSFARTHDYTELGLSKKLEDSAKSILLQVAKELE